MAEAPQKIKKSGRPQGLPLHKTRLIGRVENQLLDVFPERCIQTPSDKGKERQENQDPDANLDRFHTNLWLDAGSSEAKFRVVIDQVAALTDVSLVQWHQRSCT